MKSLRAQIRDIVENADTALALGAIHTLMPRSCSRKTVAVTICKMCEGRQLRKRKAPKSQRTHGTQYVYGPGRKAVEEIREGRAHPRKAMGFMALARQRQARARA